MFASIVTWVKGLSVAGRVGLATLGVGTAGVVALPDTSVPAPVRQEVKAEPKTTTTTETVTETSPIAFSKTEVLTDSLNQGVMEVTTPGADGVRTITYSVTKVNGIQIKKDQVSSVVTAEPVQEVTSVGTYVAPARNNCDPNYSPCVPLVSYDLDCPDIGFSVSVIGSDPHRFDRDGDGYGCEAY